jgi:hypothetical protein
MTDAASPPSLELLLATLKRQAGETRAVPPVERWKPAFCGDIDIVIEADGTWRHEGARMTREALVRLFASVLRKDEDGETYLVTPAERMRIRVVDAPFVAVRADKAGTGADQTIAFTTNMGEVVVAGPAHPIRVKTDAEGTPRPYVLVRGRLEARILRAPFFELVEWAEPRDGRLDLRSGGGWFDLGPFDAGAAS